MRLKRLTAHEPHPPSSNMVTSRRDVGPGAKRSGRSPHRFQEGDTHLRRGDVEASPIAR